MTIRSTHSPVKRGFDLLAAGGALLVLSPLLLLLAVAVRLDVGRPILFRQRRIGRGEAAFTLLKFRTMRAPAAPGEPDALRITRFGGWLRRSSLDELPQLLNVLRGEMSLVGPRPLLPRYLPYYTETERLRHTVRPGLTGWAQIHGRHRTTWDERLALDVWYARHASLALDLRILFRTVALVLRRTDTVADSTALLPPLDQVRTRPP